MGNGLNFSMKISKIFFLSIVCIFILSFGIGCDGASVEIEGSEIGSDAQEIGGLDLRGFFIGSEGTFGIITEIIVLTHASNLQQLMYLILELMILMTLEPLQNTQNLNKILQSNGGDSKMGVVLGVPTNFNHTKKPILQILR